MGTPEGYKEPGKERDTREREMERGKERKWSGGEEGEERWEKEEDWLLPAVSSLPATHRDAVLGASELLSLRVLEQWKPIRSKSEKQMAPGS